MATSKLPSFALFPLETWRNQILPDEWVACLDAWVALVASHLSLNEAAFQDISAKDESLSTFLASFIRETAAGGVAILGPSQSAKRLLKDCFLLTSRLLRSSSCHEALAQWDFLAGLCRVYSRKKAQALLSQLSESAQSSLDTSLAGLKKFLIKNLDAGLQGGDLRGIEERLDKANDLIDASPSVAAFFLAGSDFLDGLISCYKIMNPPLRKVLIATTYLSLIGLAEGQKTAALTDVLYSLKAAAQAHKAGPTSANDSLVAELVTATPILQQLQRRLDDAGTGTGRTKSVLTELATFKKPGGPGLQKPKRLVKRKVDKGKGLAQFDAAQAHEEMHIHRMSQISIVQDLFPDLGSGFVSKLFDEYGDNPEEVIGHLLQEDLPPHLRDADRSEELSHNTAKPTSKLAPRSTPPPTPKPMPHRPKQHQPQQESQLPTRHNIYDNDDLDLLSETATSRLQQGKRTDLDADVLLADRSTAPNKAAILSALAAFDSDDDERDDTYDAADVGGTVDSSLSRPGGVEDVPLVPVSQDAEATLVGAYQATPKLFERDNVTRKGKEREKLRGDTGMTDEQIEGWAVMLGRDPNRKRRLMARYGEWSGKQAEIASTAWRAGAGGDDDEDGDGESDAPVRGGGGQRGGQRGGGGGGGGGGRGGGGRGRGRGGRGGRGGGEGGGGGSGTSTPADSDVARRRKEANKGSRANHNRRDQRAKKMARGGGGGLPG